MTLAAGWLDALVSSGLTPAPYPTGATTLDDPNATQPPTPPSGSSGAPPGPPPKPRTKPPGLRDQLKATFDAARVLVFAHVELAKAEAGAIAGQVGRVLALGALALVLVIFAVFLLVIGVSLLIGEWLLGSIGWGVVHGVLFFLSVAMAAILAAVGVSGPRIARSLVLAVVVGIVVGVVLGLDLLNQAYKAIGDATSWLSIRGSARWSSASSSAASSA